MAQIVDLNDQTWAEAVGDKPALILLTTGNDLRGDFSTQFKKAAQERDDIVFAQVDASKNPQLAAQFNVNDKPVMVGFYCGDTLVRRARPWGSDVVAALDLLNDTYKEQQQMSNQPENNSEAVVESGVPVHVTDATFQTEVIDYSKEKVVLVDFWAEWCGPCRMVAPILDTLAAEYADQIRIAKVDTDANQGLAQSFQIMSIPTIMVLKGGHIIFSQPGALPEQAFRQLIDQAIELDVEKAIAEAEAAQNADNE